jgi:hypothetical protein
MKKIYLLVLIFLIMSCSRRQLFDIDCTVEFTNKSDRYYIQEIIYGPEGIVYSDIKYIKTSNIDSVYASEYKKLEAMVTKSIKLMELR